MVHEVQPFSAERESESESRRAKRVREQPYVLYQVCSQLVTASSVLLFLLCCDCWVYSQGRAVHGACTMQCVCVGPLEEGKNFGKIFSFFKRGENIVKGEGCLGEGWDKDEFCSSVCYDFETWNFFFLKRERGTGCEGEVNKDESVCLFVFNGSYVSVSSPVVLCEQGWS